jgi:hypothetical protein
MDSTDSFTLRSDSHAHCAELIPWLVNGTLIGPPAAAVRAHLAECTACQADYAHETRLCEETRAESPVLFAAEASLQKLMARVDAAERGEPGGVADLPVPPLEPEHEPALVRRRERAPGRRSISRARVARRVQWLAAAVVVQAVGLGAFAWLWHSGATGAAEEARYQVLGAQPAVYGRGARVRIVFEPQLSLADMQKLLHSVGAHIVDGPTEANVYTLGFAEPLDSSGELSARLEKLRASESVRFAEPASRDAP